MGFINIILKLDYKDFPLLKNIKKNKRDKILLKIFKTGYQIHFPSNDEIKKQVEYNEIIERIECLKSDLKSELKTDDLNIKLNSLELSISKLIGLSSNSSKKGNFGENILEDIFNKRYGDIIFERKSSVAHSGDAWLYLPNDKKIMLESKNYTNTVNKDEIIKLQNDMITHHIKWGLLVSFNSSIQGMKELDYHTFNHNNETYSIIMISHLSQDINKLDLGIQIIRKLMNLLDNLPNFPWIINDINNSINDLNEIIKKNYCLRDSYYNMETAIQKQLSNYHIILRDYQYEIEKKINEILNKIQSTMNESINNKYNNIDKKLLDKYTDKKIYDLLFRLIDIIKNKNWNININNKNCDIINNNKNIGWFKIYSNKITISIDNILINLIIGKDKENKENIDKIKNL